MSKYRFGLQLAGADHSVHLNADCAGWAIALRTLARVLYAAFSLAEAACSASPAPQSLSWEERGAVYLNLSWTPQVQVGNASSLGLLEGLLLAGSAHVHPSQALLGR